jgi:hypothetical protein
LCQELAAGESEETRTGVMGIRVKEKSMDHRRKGRGQLHQWVGGIVLLATVLVASAIPGHTRSGGHSFRGGHGFHGGHRFHGGHGWGGVGVSIGVGPYWWPSYWWPYDYSYAYPYVYPYTYSPPISVQPSQPLTIQPHSPSVWYYCENPQGYYPYVQQCPGGWRTVAPSPQ